MDEKLNLLLQEFRKLHVKEPPETTFLEIISKSHLENIWSRILAFYFDPQKGHKMKDLLISSYFEAINMVRPSCSFKSYKVLREYQTTNGRIDILIESEDFVVGIENKVNALLNNDLLDYAKTIKAVSGNRKALLLLLSKNKTEVSRKDQDDIDAKNVKFHSLTYDRFIAVIRKNIGQYHTQADTKYFIFFLDFIDNIEKNLNIIYMLNDRETMNFFINKYEDVTRFKEKLDQLNKEKNIALNHLLSTLIQDTSWVEKIMEIIPIEGVSILPPYIYDNYIFIEIKVKNQKIFVSQIYFEEDYKWCGYSVTENVFAPIFTEYVNGVFRGEKYELSLFPWEDHEFVKKQFIDKVINCAELVRINSNFIQNVLESVAV